MHRLAKPLVPPALRARVEFEGRVAYQYATLKPRENLASSTGTLAKKKPLAKPGLLHRVGQKLADIGKSLGLTSEKPTQVKQPTTVEKKTAARPQPKSTREVADVRPQARKLVSATLPPPKAPGTYKVQKPVGESIAKENEAWRQDQEKTKPAQSPAQAAPKPVGDKVLFRTMPKPLAKLGSLKPRPIVEPEAEETREKTFPEQVRNLAPKEKPKAAPKATPPREGIDRTPQQLAELAKSVNDPAALAAKQEKHDEEQVKKKAEARKTGAEKGKETKAANTAQKKKVLATLGSLHGPKIRAPKAEEAAKSLGAADKKKDAAAKKRLDVAAPKEGLKETSPGVWEKPQPKTPAVPTSKPLATATLTPSKSEQPMMPKWPALKPDLTPTSRNVPAAKQPLQVGETSLAGNKKVTEPTTGEATLRKQPYPQSPGVGPRLPVPMELMPSSAVAAFKKAQAEGRQPQVSVVCQQHGRHDHAIQYAKGCNPAMVIDGQMFAPETPEQRAALEEASRQRDIAVRGKDQAFSDPQAQKDFLEQEKQNAQPRLATAPLKKEPLEMHKDVVNAWTEQRQAKMADAVGRLARAARPGGELSIGGLRQIAKEIGVKPESNRKADFVKSILNHYGAGSEGVSYKNKLDRIKHVEEGTGTRFIDRVTKAMIPHTEFGYRENEPLSPQAVAYQQARARIEQEVKRAADAAHSDTLREGRTVAANPQAKPEDIKTVQSVHKAVRQRLLNAQEDKLQEALDGIGEQWGTPLSVKEFKQNYGELSR